MYEFSVPMPFEKELIDDIEAINHKIEKSKITSMYFALHSNCPDNPGFGQARTYHPNTNIDYWIDLIKYSLDKGFDFVYLLNSPKSFLSESNLFDKQLEKLDKLLKRLEEVGCNKLRVTNTQLMGYLIKDYPQFKIYASTSLEYSQLKQYTALLRIFPGIVEIVPAADCNKNFELLKNLKTAMPNIGIELMVNEGCMHSCPLRMHHNFSIPIVYTKILNNRPSGFKHNFFLQLCSIYNDDYHRICNPNLIYPWEIDKYSELGFNKFKLVGRNSDSFFKTGNKKTYEIYLKGVDDYKQIENEGYVNLNHYVEKIQTKIKEVKPYLPDINYFIKNGHLCSSICGVKCNYCDRCAEEMKKYVNIF